MWDSSHQRMWVFLSPPSQVKGGGGGGGVLTDTGAERLSGNGSCSRDGLLDEQQALNRQMTDTSPLSLTTQHFVFLTDEVNKQLHSICNCSVFLALSWSELKAGAAFLVLPRLPPGRGRHRRLNKEGLFIKMFS